MKGKKYSVEKADYYTLDYFPSGSFCPTILHKYYFIVIDLV